MFFLITWAARASDSTSSTSAAPRERASRPTAPDPANRSSTAAPSRPPRMAVTVPNRPSRVRSLVGRVDRPAGTASRRPPASPAIMRVTGPLARGGLAGTASGLLEVLGALVLEQGADRVGQRGMTRQRGIGSHQVGGRRAGIDDQVLVVQHAEDLEAGSARRLRGAQHVALTALAQVNPGELETVRGPRDG